MTDFQKAALTMITYAFTMLASIIAGINPEEHLAITVTCVGIYACLFVITKN